MDEASLCWWFLCFVALWRMITVRTHNYCPSIVVKYLSWYVIMSVGIILLFVRSMYDVIVFEYIKLDFLDRGKVNHTLHQFLDPEKDAMELEQLAIHEKLRFVSLIGPLAGGLAVVLVIYQLYRFSSADNPTTRSAREIRDMVFMTIAMPAVFSVMALRSTIRMWTIMTGSAWLGRENICAGECSWNHLKTIELATYQADLGIASAFQFYTVYLFARLCAFLLQHSQFIKDSQGRMHDIKKLNAYKTRLSHAAVQGVYAYVLIGVIRSLAEVIAAVGSEFPAYSEQAANFQDSILAKTDTVNAFVTMGGVVNMFVIGNLEDITEVMGSANMKFNGTRLLLLISQIQLTLLKVFTVDSKLHDNFMDALGAHPEYKDLPITKWLISAFNFSSYQASLFHSSLLAFECLFVALLNYCAWRKNDYVKIIAHASKASSNLNQPLLYSNDIEIEDIPPPAPAPQEEESAVGTCAVS
eukprot:TRINITY_DN64782_c0_g1_i1.p1 TRINITY_DN64782_c0_g1~~TRINITY_DN64782_c0_g1_i1.p1  ORF type:complete len:470 (+),score=85.27 TRINITY_DN64782_c0_g1_i1:72-1481(+)